MDAENKKYKILLTGGGTGGSVMPLLAIYDELRNPLNPPLQGGQNTKPPLQGGGGGVEFLWLGTKYGPEREMVASTSLSAGASTSLSAGASASSAQGAGIKFRAICGGKWRRYFSLKNLVDIIKIKIGFWQALFIMLKWRPSLVMSAGSFVSVPVVWAAWFLRVPVLIHQQDARPGLANKLMAPFAKIITVTFEKSLKDYGGKAVWTGNPVRKNFQFPISNFQFNKLDKTLPILLILGGGTGAMAINELVAKSLGELTRFCQIIHVTGKNKDVGRPHSSPLLSKERGYCVYEFLDAEKMAEAMKLADVVVSRAGMGVLSELSYLGKPAIIIPMPESHQAENSAMFKDAAIVLEQKNLMAGKLVNEIKSLVENEELRKKLGEKMGRAMKRGANQAIVKVILGLYRINC